MWIGRLIAALDERWNRRVRAPGERRGAGVAALVVIVLVSGAVASVVQGLLAHSIVGIVVLAFVAGSLIAQKSLETHVAAVAEALETGGLEAGRAAVAKIVGRDPDTLDEAGVSRAAIESLAENFSDGVVAPAFWLALLGLAGIPMARGPIATVTGRTDGPSLNQALAATGAVLGSTSVLTAIGLVLGG